METTNCIHGMGINSCATCKPRFIIKKEINQKYKPATLDNENPIEPIKLWFLFRYKSSLKYFGKSFGEIDKVINEGDKKYESLQKKLVKKNIGNLPWKYPFGNMKNILKKYSNNVPITSDTETEIHLELLEYIEDPIWKKLPGDFDDEDICTYFTIKLKNKYQSVIEDFANWIKDSKIIGNEEKTICCVPSSEMGVKNGVHLLCNAISNKNNKILDASECLIRTINVPKAHLGGPRDQKIHLDSIEIKNSEKFQSKKILLIDDVASTCSTLEACIEKIKSTKPLEIETLVLGRNLLI